MCVCVVNELYLVQSKHVEVTDVILLGVSDPGPALLLIDHLSDVLAYKLTLTGKKKDSAVHLIEPRQKNRHTWLSLLFRLRRLPS